MKIFRNITTLFVMFAMLAVFAVPNRAFAQEPSSGTPSLAVEIYKTVTGLNPDEPAIVWLDSQKSYSQLSALTSYLIDIVYDTGSSGVSASGLYKTITGLSPDKDALEWLGGYTSRDSLKDLANYLLSIRAGTRNFLPNVSAPSVRLMCDTKDISVPVLMYHYIHPPGEAASAYWSSSFEQFERQISWLKENGFSTITADELYEFMASGSIKNPRSVVLIFDDDWYDSVKYRVLPLMRKYGYTATLALYTSGVYEKAENAFTWEELRAWEKEGIVDVQSHSVTHPLIPALHQLSDAQLWSEMNSSKQIMESKLGKQVSGFIAPGGSVNDRVLSFARSAGYKTFYLLWEKEGVKYGGDPLWIYRVNMVNTLTFGAFTEKMERQGTQTSKCAVPAPESLSSPSLLERNHIVTYYGSPYTPLMGILGEVPYGASTREKAEFMARMIKDKAAEYDALNGEKGVIAAFHLVFGTVHPEGRIGLLDRETVLEYIRVAKENNMIVILDHQIGRYSVESAVRDMLEYLAYDNVHLAFDPEWHTSRPMQDVGSVSGYEINAAQELIQQYMEAQGIPGKKILIVHQFAPSMITSRDAVRSDYSKVSLVHDMDGFGHPRTKKSHYAYNAFAANMPLKAFKLFYAGTRQWGIDAPIMVPEEVLGLDPQPVIIIYQ